MKTKILVALVAGLVTLAGIPQAGAEEKLESGKDRIDVPAIRDGLCLHNLFQSGMVLQRDKPEDSATKNSSNSKSMRSTKPSTL